MEANKHQKFLAVSESLDLAPLPESCLIVLQSTELHLTISDAIRLILLQFQFGSLQPLANETIYSCLQINSFIDLVGSAGVYA